MAILCQDMLTMLLRCAMLCYATSATLRYVVVDVVSQVYELLRSDFGSAACYAMPGPAVL
eukprot:876224-Pyramimonas_sp.AAC.1